MFLSLLMYLLRALEVEHHSEWSTAVSGDWLVQW